MDESANGHSNGALKGGKGANGINGKPSQIARRPTPPAKTWGFWGFATRLMVWSTIYTLLFRCPSSIDECTESSPYICKPYFQVKQVVAPHFVPYYDTYAAPYVEIAKPYYETVDRTIITPTRTYAVKYGGPQLTRAQALALSQWEKNVQPQINKYQVMAKAQYDQSIAPHVEKASTAIAPYYEMALPYYDIARTNALQTYHEILLPSCRFVQPYAAQGYSVVYVFTADTVIPSTQWAWNKTYAFLDSTVWPHLRDVYVMKVEPQLHRIGARLGRYKEKNLKSSPVDKAPPAPKSTFSKPSSSLSSTTTPIPDPTPESETGATVTETESAEETASVEIKVEAKEPKDREEMMANAAKTVAEDLETWQSKFSKAYDDAADEIEVRVEEMSNEMIRDQANVTGKALVSKLDKLVQTEISGLKKTLLVILQKHKDDGESTEGLSQDVANAVRAAGLKIREKAQAVRTWRQEYEFEIETAVTNIAAEHIKILESIRDLALQKIGMKWAWMDGITYKDWQKYHELRERLDEWTEDMKRLVTSHPGISVAQTAGMMIEDEGMAIAGDAAAELGNLKQVAVWKALASDFDSNDWHPESVQKKVEEVERKKAEKAAAAAAQKQAEEEAAAKEKAEREAQEQENISTTTIKTGETVTVSLAEAANMASDTVLPDMPLAAANTSDSEPIDGPEQLDEMIIEPDVSSSTTATPTAVKSAMFGAAAQSVPSRQPILDEVESCVSSAASVVTMWIPGMPTMSSVPEAQWQKVQSIAQYNLREGMNWAASQFESAKVAIGAAEPTPSAAVERMQKMLDQAQHNYYAGVGIAHARYSEFLYAAAHALSSITATPTPTDIQGSASSVASVASEALVENWDALVNKVSQGVYGKPTPTPWYENLYSTVASAASEATEAASSVASAASETVSSMTDKVKEAAESIKDEL